MRDFADFRYSGSMGRQKRQLCALQSPAKSRVNRFAAQLRAAKKPLNAQSLPLIGSLRKGERGQPRSLEFLGAQIYASICQKLRPALQRIH